MESRTRLLEGLCALPCKASQEAREHAQVLVCGCQGAPVNDSGTAGCYRQPDRHMICTKIDSLLWAMGAPPVLLLYLMQKAAKM